MSIDRDRLIEAIQRVLSVAALCGEPEHQRDIALILLALKVRTRQRDDLIPRNVDRELLGRIVREAWIAWAKEQPSPKASWLVPWDGLGEADREVDRRIGEAVYAIGYAAGRPSHRIVALLAALDEAAGNVEDGNVARASLDRSTEHGAGFVAGIKRAAAIILEQFGNTIPREVDEAVARVVTLLPSVTNDGKPWSVLTHWAGLLEECSAVKDDENPSPDDLARIAAEAIRCRTRPSRAVAGTGR
jgi:hypothetical protein